jgi:MoxR-like ATPase
VLADASVRDRVASLTPLITADVVAQMGALADEITVDNAILAYVSRLAEETRRHPHTRLGLSVRGCLAYVRCAKTWAASDGRNYVLPDDIKDLSVPILCHRLLLDPEAQFAGTTVEQVIDEILAAVAPPVDRAA